MRTLVHILTAATLLVSFQRSPLDHVHEDESEHARAHASIHSHWSSHTSAPAPAWEQADDHDALWLDWYAGDGSTTAIPLAILVATQHHFELTPVAIHAAAPRPCNHDPPALLTLPARAPPAYTLL